MHDKTMVTKPATKTEPEDLTEAIKRISEGMERLRRSGLNQDAIIVLLKDYTNISKTDIKYVLNGLTDLAKRYTRP